MRMSIKGRTKISSLEGIGVAAPLVFHYETNVRGVCQ